MVLIFIAAVLLGRFRLNGSRRTLLKLAAVIILVLDNLSSAIYTVAARRALEQRLRDLGVRRARRDRRDAAGRRRRAA